MSVNRLARHISATGVSRQVVRRDFRTACDTELLLQTMRPRWVKGYAEGK